MPVAVKDPLEVHGFRETPVLPEVGRLFRVGCRRGKALRPEQGEEGHQAGVVAEAAAGADRAGGDVGIRLGEDIGQERVGAGPLEPFEIGARAEMGIVLEIVRLPEGIPFLRREYVVEIFFVINALRRGDEEIESVREFPPVTAADTVGVSRDSEQARDERIGIHPVPEPPEIRLIGLETGTAFSDCPVRRIMGIGGRTRPHIGIVPLPRVHPYRQRRHFRRHLPAERAHGHDAPARGRRHRVQPRRTAEHIAIPLVHPVRDPTLLLLPAEREVALPLPYRRIHPHIPLPHRLPERRQRPGRMGSFEPPQYPVISPDIVPGSVPAPMADIERLIPARRLTGRRRLRQGAVPRQRRLPCRG